MFWCLLSENLLYPRSYCVPSICGRFRGNKCHFRDVLCNVRHNFIEISTMKWRSPLSLRIGTIKDGLHEHHFLDNEAVVNHLFWCRFWLVFKLKTSPTQMCYVLRLSVSKEINSRHYFQNISCYFRHFSIAITARKLKARSWPYGNHSYKRTQVQFLKESVCISNIVNALESKYSPSSSIGKLDGRLGF